jgi:hypothetical protein
MAKKTCILDLEIEYDDEKTDPEALAEALDRILATGLSTPGIMSEYGELDVGEFGVAGDGA